MLGKSESESNPEDGEEVDTQNVDLLVQEVESVDASRNGVLVQEVAR